MWPLRSSRPGWSGMMQAVHQDPHPGKASITFLPMIDLNPNDMSCVYSTLRFVATECKRHEVTPILTFDQPLWWKGQLIIANEPAGGDLHALILRLGGYHAEMSFLGCIGSVMAASGLEELLGEVFAPNTVKHVISGKALARAVRGHMLVDSALSALITEQTFPAAIRSEASCGEPNNTIYQATESTSAMYWCYSVTMQIHRRRNSTTEQREGGTQSQECGTSIRCSGHWVQKCVAYCRLLTQ